MANDMYEVLALIPMSSDFSIDSAVRCFESLKFGKTLLRSEVARTEGNPMHGFRVWYGDWAIVAWPDDTSGVVADSQELASREPLPAPRDVIASCTKRLSIISDEDPDLNHSDEITHFTDVLRERYGTFIWDPVNGEWWS